MPVRSSSEGNRLTVDGVVEVVKTGGRSRHKVAGLVQQFWCKLVIQSNKAKSWRVSMPVRFQQELACRQPRQYRGGESESSVGEKRLRTAEKALFDKITLAKPTGSCCCGLEINYGWRKAQTAQASAVQTQSSFYTLNAPF